MVNPCDVIAERKTGQKQTPDKNVYTVNPISFPIQARQRMVAGGLEDWVRC